MQPHKPKQIKSKRRATKSPEKLRTLVSFWGNQPTDTGMQESSYQLKQNNRKPPQTSSTLSSNLSPLKKTKSSPIKIIASRKNDKIGVLNFFQPATRQYENTSTTFERQKGNFYSQLFSFQ